MALCATEQVNMSFCSTTFVPLSSIRGTPPTRFPHFRRDLCSQHLSRRHVLNRHLRFQASGQKHPPPPKRQNPKKPLPNSDSFSGFAAGPGASTPRRAPRPTLPTDKPIEPDSKVSKSTSETSSSEQSGDDSSKSSSSEPLRAVRALGTSPPSKSPSFSTRKTAADFIAEGVVDDVEESSPFLASDIRFGIDDVKDPFKEDDLKQNAQRVQFEQEQLEQSVGQTVDVIGDGSVKKTVISTGSGPPVASDAKVTVEYTGKLENGSVFDSSRNRDDSFSFQLGSGTVIKGWEAAVATMRVGEISEFVISPTYAYGKRGMPPVVPGNAILIFEIKLLDAEGETIDDVKKVSDFNPDLPRSPGDIAKSYELMMEAKEKEKKKSFLERIYIISPFMSQTGEKPPWWINPNITFVLIAIFTAFGFYLVLISGAIHVGYVDHPVDVNIFK